MIDPSVFFRSRPIFWSWILVPLVLRVLVMLGLAAATQVPEEALRKQTALVAAAPILLQTIEDNRSVLQSFVSKKLSSKERFLTDSAELLYQTGLQGTTQVTEKKGAQGLKTYQFCITGTAPTLPKFSQFLDDLGQVDYLHLRKGELVGRSIQNQNTYSFSLTFERVEYQYGTTL